MPHPAWDNLDVFLNPDDFGVQAIFTPQGGNGTAFPANVIFDEPFYDAKLGEYLMDAAEPRCTAKESDVAGLKKYDLATIAGIRLYLTHDPLPDGVGMAVVKLARDLGEVTGAP